MKKLFLSLLLLLTVTVVWAQVPQQISYQSLIRDGNNVVVASSPIGIKISLLQGTATGPAVYVETHSKTTNANGLVSLEIGTGTVLSGSFASIDWANGPYLIQSETDPTGGVNYSIPVVMALNSVPYALFAANGTAGPKGDKGDTGATGAKGDAGAQGATGAAGPQGLTGPAGTNGTNGAQGPIGLTGPAGAKGDKGDIGATGATGVAGPAGPQGLPGAVGPAGPQGVVGAAGTNGTNGAQGPIGLTGPAGAKGDKGDIGATGATGVAGAAGPKGDTGAAGTNGTNGAQGPIGLPGPAGPQGVAGAVGPAGPKGDTGAAGTNGTNGAQGPIGLTGPAGAKGDTGATGPKGDTGAAGPQGEAGAAGTNGTNGAQGPIGLTGPAGPQGVAGAVGPAGPKGDTGAAGTQGVAGPAGGFTHYLGELFNGGIIYYLYKGSDGSEHGLIVALTESNKAWQSSPVLRTFADRTDDGAYNTNLMTNSLAADYVASLGSGWYLPSNDELILLYTNRFTVQKALRAGGYTPLYNHAYSTSTEKDTNNGYILNFDTGSVVVGRKTDGRPVRGVRSF
uniref:hypothetical protein n=1 Tax=Algoriphagus sp. TaxID=1872435 RepID=UPI00404816E0